MPIPTFMESTTEVLPGVGLAPVETIVRSSSASVLAGQTALAGGGQTGATPITAKFNEFTVVATAADSSLLPKSAAGMSLYVDNAGAASMNVFPASGEKINGGTANAAFAVANGKRCLFYCVVAGNWKTLLTA